jgi:hypothetical protein
MKKSITILLAAATGFVLAVGARAAESNSPAILSAPAADLQPAPTPAPANLPYGVADILKLSRAQISDDVILNYIQNSGTIYNLAPKDIVYLHDQGVSERVLTAMLAQRQLAAASPSAPAPQSPLAQAAVPAPPPPAPNNIVEAPLTPVYNPPAGIVTPPSTPAPSTVYVIPYAPAEAAYYGYYTPYYGTPYYGGYYAPGYCYGGYYGGPVVSFGFGFGGRGHYYGGWHGGFHGGFRGGVHGGGHR